VSRDRLVVILGPTATGKSRLAMELALRFGGEIISADSMQVYRYMDIGTAKPSEEERRRIRHHLIDIRNPDEEFTVAEFKECAERAIAMITQRGRLPLLVGGTGLYIRALLEDYTFPRGPRDEKYRQGLWSRARAEGPQALHRELAAIDPEAAARIHPNDVRRIIRALEVYRYTGKPLSESADRRPGRYNCVKIGLYADRTLLYSCIDKRVDAMMEAGLLDEVRRLRDMGYGYSLTSRQALGYKELLAYLAGQDTLAEAVQKIKRETRKFAKRQTTWFKRERDVYWFDTGTLSFERVVDNASTLLAGKLWCW